MSARVSLAPRKEFVSPKKDRTYVKHSAQSVLIVSRTEIAAALADIDAIAAMERAFSDFSAGRANITPVGELLFPEIGRAHV